VYSELVSKNVTLKFQNGDFVSVWSGTVEAYDAETKTIKFLRSHKGEEKVVIVSVEKIISVEVE
jgi:hypothetical protein